MRTIKQTKSKNVITSVILASALFFPTQIMADWTWDDVTKVTKKVVKKVALPVTAVVSGVAEAAEAYDNGKSASEIATHGLGGVATHIGRSIVETTEDVITIGNVAVDAYNE